MKGFMTDWGLLTHAILWLKNLSWPSCSHPTLEQVWCIYHVIALGTNLVDARSICPFPAWLHPESFGQPLHHLCLVLLDGSNQGAVSGTQPHVSRSSEIVPQPRGQRASRLYIIVQIALDYLNPFFFWSRSNEEINMSDIFWFTVLPLGRRGYTQPKDFDTSPLHHKFPHHGINFI